MMLLGNFLTLGSVVEHSMKVIGASYKIVEILDYKPKINSTGGIRIDEIKPQTN